MGKDKEVNNNGARVKEWNVKVSGRIARTKEINGGIYGSG